MFGAIANPTRREILSLLRSGRHTVGEIAGNFRASRPAISKHLRLLRSAGLVASRRDGMSRICELDAEPLLAINHWLQDYSAFWDESLHTLKKFVEKKR